MRMSVWVLAVSGLFAACGGDSSANGGTNDDGRDAVGSSNAAAACDDYIRAATDCYAEAGEPPPVDASVCNEYDGITGEVDQQAAELFDCYVDVLDSGDCSDLIAAGETFRDLSTCP